MLKQLNCSIIHAALASWTLATCSHAQLFISSPQRDIEQGAEVAKLVERQIGLCSLPVTEAYLREVGRRLVAAADDPRLVKVLGNAEIGKVRTRRHNIRRMGSYVIRSTILPDGVLTFIWPSGYFSSSASIAF